MDEIITLTEENKAALKDLIKHLSTIEGEEWIDIRDFEDFYSVSNMGRIFHKKGQKILPGVSTTVILFKNGRQFNFERSRLVAAAFIPNPNNLPVVEHIDGDTLNNKAENLQWVDWNSRHKEKITNDIRNKTAAKHGIIRCYGPNDQYLEARSHREAQSMTGVGRTSIANSIKNGTVIRGWRFVRDGSNQSGN